MVFNYMKHSKINSINNTNKHNSISLIICTRNNHKKLQLTLEHLAKHLPNHIQVIIVDQSTKNMEHILPNKINSLYLWTPQERGLSKARNVALQHTQAEVLAWTDDDCIITKNYIESLNKILELAPIAKEKKIAGVCGKTTPFLPTKPSDSHHCPCTFSKKNTSPVNKVCVHWKKVGLGNNMVFFRYIFSELGNFKKWLGIGGVAQSGEDGEVILRCLIANKTFLYDEKLLIHHNKWLDKSQLRKQILKYNCGGIAIYGYYYFQGIDECQKEFIQNIKNATRNLVRHIRDIKKQKTILIHYIYDLLKELFYIFNGIIIAFIFSNVTSSLEKKRIKNYKFNSKNNSNYLKKA